MYKGETPSTTATGSSEYNMMLPLRLVYTNPPVVNTTSPSVCSARRFTFIHLAGSRLVSLAVFLTSTFYCIDTVGEFDKEDPRVNRMVALVMQLRTISTHCANPGIAFRRHIYIESFYMWYFLSSYIYLEDNHELIRCQ